jgi:hypothetical protein
MATKRKHADFVKFLASQLEALRTRRFDELDVETLVDEMESVVGQYRHAVGDHAQRLIEILMRPYYVYGDWNDLHFESDMLHGALKDSPSLAKTAAAEIKHAYEMARLRAELYSEPGWLQEWPKRCPWKTLKDLLAAVKARDAEYLALERAGDEDFANLHRAAWKSTL